MDEKNKQTIFHIGLPKTGTTWVQDVYYHLLENVHYIDVSPQNNIAHEHPLLSELINLCRIPADDLHDDVLARIRNAVLSHLENGLNLLSNENYFTGMPDTACYATVSEISQNLSKLFPDLRVIIILRNQIQFLQSFYLQKLYVANEYRSFSKFLDRSMETLIPYLKYHDLINCWHNIIGKENVYVSTYEHFKSDRDEFLKKLCGFIGTESPSLSKRQAMYANRSLSFYSYKTTILVNKLYRRLKFQRNERLNKYMLRAKQNLFRFCKERIDPNVIYRFNLNREILNPKAEMLKAYYAESNEYLSELVRINLKAFGYP